MSTQYFSSDNCHKQVDSHYCWRCRHLFYCLALFLWYGMFSTSFVCCSPVQYIFQLLCAYTQMWMRKSVFDVLPHIQYKYRWKVRQRESLYCTTPVLPSKKAAVTLLCYVHRIQYTHNFSALISVYFVIHHFPDNLFCCSLASHYFPVFLTHSSIYLIALCTFSTQFSPVPVYKIQELCVLCWVCDDCITILYAYSIRCNHFHNILWVAHEM